MNAVLQDAGDTEEVRAHLAACDACAGSLRSLQALETAGAEARKQDLTAVAQTKTRVRAAGLLRKRTALSGGRAATERLVWHRPAAVALLSAAACAMLLLTHGVHRRRAAERLAFVAMVGSGATHFATDTRIRDLQGDLDVSLRHLQGRYLRESPQGGMARRAAALRTRVDAVSTRVRRDLGAAGTEDGSDKDRKEQRDDGTTEVENCNGDGDRRFAGVCSGIGAGTGA